MKEARSRSVSTPPTRSGLVADTHVAWGNADGTVTVCDIQEIRRRLAAVGLEW